MMRHLVAWVGMLVCLSWSHAQVRGSMIEDRAARKLLEAGDARLDANETEKAIEIWKSVIERYPRSKVRFRSHMRLGDYFLKKENAYEGARSHYEAAAEDENPDEDIRAKATLMTGVCFFEARHYGNCFKVMREVIESFPTRPEVNQAYHYIGMAHFRQGHYSRAIEALEKVGTALTEDDEQLEKLEAGKRLFIKIEDADLAILGPDETLAVVCKTRSGDEETISCRPVGRNVRVVLGSVPSTLGKAKPGNGVLEVVGGDEIDVLYTDRHTAERAFNKERLKTVVVVGNAVAQIMDGAFHDSLGGVVLGKEANLQIKDADFDISDKADKLTALVEIHRPKTEAEIEAEIAEKIAKGDDPEPDEDGSVRELEVDKYKKVDELTLTFTEADLREPKAEGEERGADLLETPEPEPEPGLLGGDPVDDDLGDFLSEVEAEANAEDDSIHTGIFRATVLIERADEARKGDPVLQALPSDRLKLVFDDKLNRSSAPLVAVAKADCIEGNLGAVRVTRTEIGDEELRLKTRLRTASALCNIGNHYKEFGLEAKANVKYGEALEVCDEITTQARRLGGSFLEETYVQLWRIYFAMDERKLASAISRRLQQEFPNSSFVDEAIYQQAAIAQKSGDWAKAISLYHNLMQLKNSSLRGEGQYGIAECYEKMAAGQPPEKAAGLFERSFQQYKKVYDEFPESGRVGDAVAKMANFYYQKKDYSRAIDVFEDVLREHPDANFLDVILFNYGRCLYRLNKKPEARRKFDQLLNDFPDSTLAGEAKRISDALIKSGF